MTLTDYCNFSDKHSIVTFGNWMVLGSGNGPGRLFHSRRCLSYQWAVLHVVICSNLLILIFELIYAQILFLFG